MPMTKAEKAEMDLLMTEVAFRWPTEVEPQPMTREEIDAAKETLLLKNKSAAGRARIAARGWVMNVHTGRIEKAWSDGQFHGWGNWTGDSGTRDMGRLYRTMREAAVALRWATCRQMAQQLRAIDALILGAGE